MGGYQNDVPGIVGSILGGEANVAADEKSSIVGGCNNVTGTTTAPFICSTDTADETIGGGDGNVATGP